MRSVLEGLAARMAASNWTQLDLQTLSSLAERMERAEEHPGEWLQIHEEFHRHIWVRARMPRLQLEIQRQTAAVAPYLRVFLLKHGMGELKGSKHRALVEALRAGKPGAAERAVREHIEHALEEICELIAAKSPPNKTD
jgi:DNA-binding GntR family transcriptional regulator